MNRSRFFCLGLLFFAASRADVAALGPDINSSMPPPRMPVELRTSPDPNDFGKFEGGGKLLYQKLIPGWLATYVYFPRGKRYGIELQNNPSAVNVFFAAEIRRAQTTRKFIEEHLALFLSCNFGDYGTVVIDKQWVRTSPDLKSFLLPGKPVVTGDTWTLEVNVLKWDGAVQHWSFKGQVLPLRINSFLCETRQPSGKYPGMILAH